MTKKPVYTQTIETLKLKPILTDLATRSEEITTATAAAIETEVKKLWPAATWSRNQETKKIKDQLLKKWSGIYDIAPNTTLKINIYGHLKEVTVNLAEENVEFIALWSADDGYNPIDI